MKTADRAADDAEPVADPRDELRRTVGDAHRASNTDQAAAKADQSTAHADQELSAADQRASNADQHSTGMDQLASDRDQAAADRQHAAGVGLTPADERAYKATHDEREAVSVAREENRVKRTRTSGHRDATAAKRDRNTEARGERERTRDARVGVGRRAIDAWETSMRAEDTLSRESGARYRGLLEAAPDAMVVVDGRGEIVLLNVQAEKQFGYRRDELVGQPVRNIIPVGFAERLIADDLRSAADALAQQIGTGIELSGRRKDGTEFPIEIMLSPLESAEGILVTAAIRDISARRAAEEELKGQARLLDLAHDAIVVRDPDSHIVYWSKGAEATYGWTAEEVSGRVTHELLHTVFPTARSAVDASLEVAGDWKGELVHTARDGRKLTVESRQSVDRDAHGRVRAILEINRDVTERKAAEGHLTQMEGRYRGLLESAPDAMVVVNPAGEIVLVNVQAERQFGYRRDELTGQPVELLVPRRLHGRHVENRDLYGEAPRVREMGTGIERSGRRKDGSEFPIEIMLSPIESAEGTLVTATIRDVTMRVAAEQERSRLASAVEQAADAISMHGLDGIVTYVNPAFTRAYGYEPAEIVGRHGGMIDGGRHDAAFFEAIRATASAGRTWTGTIVNRRKDGTPIEVEAVISAIQDAGGRVASYVQADRDVTRERELERGLERDAREREAIETALARIDPAGSAEEIAAAACIVINGLPGVDSTWAAALDVVDGAVLAATGPLAPTFARGRPIPPSRAGYLCERGSGGAWFEEWRPRADDGAWSEAVTSTGLRAMAYAPLRSPRGVVGIVGIGSHDPLTAQSLVEHVPALATFASILGAQLVPKLEGRRRDAEARLVIRAVIDASAFGPFFQPIVDLHSGAVVGYEALTRFADRVPPDTRFAAAARAGLEIELETATLRAALAAAAAVLPPRAYLSLNASPALIASGGLRSLVAGLDRPMVLEITEHVAIDDYVALRAELATLEPKIRLAVDDAGAGYASFRHILELAPDFVKLDIGLIRGINDDPARQALVAGMGYFATKSRIRLVAEGVETIAELRTLRSLAIHYGQGYLLGRPQDGRGPGPWPTSIAVPSS